MSETRSVVVVLTVPSGWTGLDVDALERKLWKNPGIMAFLAQEVKRCLDQPDIVDPRTIGEKLIALMEDKP